MSTTLNTDQEWLDQGVQLTRFSGPAGRTMYQLTVRHVTIGERDLMLTPEQLAFVVLLGLEARGEDVARMKQARENGAPL